MPVRRSLFAGPALLMVATVLAVPAVARAENLMTAGGGAAFAPFSSGMPGDSPQAREQVRKLGEQKKAEEEKKREELASPKARAERADSRTAHDALADGAATGLLRDKFGRELAPPVPDAETLFGGDRVAEFRSDYVAVLEASGDRPARLIDSQVPLRAPKSGQAGADKAPVDLDLVADGGGYAPDNGLARVELPKEAGDGIQVGPVTVKPEGRAGVARVDSDTLAYPNIDTDTDLAVNVTPTGFETYHQIRGPRAPQSQRLKLALPAGTSLRAVAGGGAEVVRGSESVLSISAPEAVDAQGAEVPSSYEIDGDTLVIETPHRGRSVAYPVLVDPEFTVKEDWACYGSYNCTATWFHGNPTALDGLRHWGPATSSSSVAWGYSQNCLYWAPTFNNCYGPANGGGPNWGVSANPGWSNAKTGLHVWAGRGNYYPSGHIAEWYYQPPGTSTRIYRADFGAKFLRRGATPGGMAMFDGVWSYATGTWASNALHIFYGGEDGSNDGNLTHRWDADFAYSTPGPQAAAFGLVNLGGGVAPRDYVNAYMGATIIELTDPEAPTITKNELQGPTGWTKDGNWTVNAAASDAGLGMRRLRLGVPLASGGAATQDRWAVCNGTKDWPCPSSLAAPGSPNQAAFTFSAADGDPNTPGDQPIRDGVQTVSLNAADALGTGHDTTSGANTIRVDRSGPQVNVSGGLRALDGQWVRDGRYEIPSSATDGGSGVKRLTLKVDGSQAGAPKEVATQRDGAGLDHTFSLDTAPLKYGRHEITVTATDWLDQTSEVSWVILADARETTFTFSPGATLDEIENSGAVVDEVVSLDDTRFGDAAGGYRLDGEILADALNSYRAMYQEDEGADTAPTIRRATYGGAVPTAALGGLASKVASRDEIDLSTLPPPERDPEDSDQEPSLPYLDDLFNADIAAESQDIDTRGGDAGVASADQKEFAPDYGSSNTFNKSGTSRPRRIHQTFTWTTNNWQEEFENSVNLDDAYEHDFKLKNYSNSGGFFNKSPRCRSGESDNFWAVRSGKYWKATGKDVENGGPYFDTNLSDSCQEMDFTTGFYFPRNLKTGRKYGSIVRAKAGDSGSSLYWVIAQRSTRDCPNRNPNCVAPLGRGGDKKKFIYLNRAPECRRWRNGRQNRPC